MLKSEFCRKKFPWAPPTVGASTSLGMGRRREAKSTCVPFYIHRILLLKQSRKISTRISPLWYLMIWCGYWKRVLWSLDLIIPVCFRLDLVHFQCGQNVARKVYVHPASRYPFFRELLFLTITIKNKYLTPKLCYWYIHFCLSLSHSGRVSHRSLVFYITYGWINPGHHQIRICYIICISIVERKSL